MISSNEPLPGEQHCVLMIFAPEDRHIYNCFAEVVRTWRDLARSERLWIEHDVEIAPLFRESQSHRVLQKLFEAAPSMISKIEINIGGLAICYVRSGGHEPFRQSYFDELQFSIDSPLLLSPADVQQVVAELTSSLKVSIAEGTAFFAQFVPAIRERPPTYTSRPSQTGA